MLLEQPSFRADHSVFHRLKIVKKEQLTNSCFSLEFDIPPSLKERFRFSSGQYVTLRYKHRENWVVNDYSMTSAPFEERLSLGLKIHSEESSVNSLWADYQVGDEMEVSEPKGRFVLKVKPHEFRTILGFATGIGITPILSHFKTILHSEPRSRLFLFLGNKTRQDVPFREVLEALEERYPERLKVYYFFSEEQTGNAFTQGRLDEKKVGLIINQVLHLDETDEESTIWDSVDEVVICGRGEMIREVANACHRHGIPKKNIHFELFETFNEDIFPVEVDFPLVENLEVQFTYNGTTHTARLENNKHKILQSLSAEGFAVPFSCKSGICGSCRCRLEHGEVELLENEYLTEGEEEKGYILPCMAFALTDKITLDFDRI
ncbi:ferredoxin--NADP reductase [Bergeyella sp. RCAD1439]|uniref:ferredoxin--NADP reductase n=1 Tax=Bergeyella anatis TaxID=3113737 RepID=UPI002E189CCC|nr:ferredoxin--NADP reductase [Bergeyella sp. RCAD1439]